MRDELGQFSAIICPGIHDPQLTQEFLAGWQRSLRGYRVKGGMPQVLIFPAQDYPAYSSIHILDYVQYHIDPVKTPIVFIGFSAGVVGAIGAAWGWQVLGGQVRAFVAFDGWGVPLYGNFPIYRLSHDYFTHWSSALLGGGQDSFYADPAVEHLDLWGKADICQGWRVHPAQGNVGEQRTRITAAQFLSQLFYPSSVKLG
ncbi:MAG TPA: hypothetical protein DDZ80_03615 [Cyanobacteria bacterium UBA8803]|nr:hypothetical protein [Cyanobacteria bacterium UBA8803]